MGQLDTFPKWLVTVAASAIVAIGGGLLATMVMLREDMAVVKASLARMDATTSKVDALERTVIGHDYRITTIERRQDTVWIKPRP